MAKYLAKCGQIQDQLYQVYGQKHKYTFKQFIRISDFCMSKYSHGFLDGFHGRCTRFQGHWRPLKMTPRWRDIYGNSTLATKAHSKSCNQLINKY